MSALTPAEFDRFIDAANKSPAQMIEAANRWAEEWRRALLDAFPLCLPHRTEGWVRWCGDSATARRRFRSYGHRGRARVVNGWARRQACVPSLMIGPVPR